MSKALFLVRGGLVLDLLYHWPKFFQRGGVLGAELLRRATQIGVLDGVEHLACERQRSAAMILLTDEVEFRPRRLMALEAIEPQEVVNFLRSLANNFRAVLVGVEGEELPIVRPSTVPARLPARLSTKKCFTGVILVMHWNVEASTLYFGSPACTLPAHSKSAAKHETLLVSAKIFVRFCFIRFPPHLA